MDSARTEETNNKTSNEDNNLVQIESVKKDWEHELNIEGRKLKRKCFREQEIA